MKKMIIVAVLLVALLVPVTVFGTTANVDRLVVVEITADGESNILGGSSHLSRLNDMVGAFGFQLARTTDTIRTAVPNDSSVTVVTAEAHLVNPNHIHISGMTGTILQRIRWSSGNYYADLADVAAWLGYTHHTSVTVGNTFYYVVVREGRDVPVGLFYIGENLSLAPGETVNLSNLLINTTNVARPTWASSNRNVATVDSNGVVTARTTGTTNITATARGGHRVTIALEVRLTLSSTTDVSINGLNRLFGGAEVVWTGSHFNVRPSRNTSFYVASDFPGAVFVNGVEQAGEASFQTRYWVIEIWSDNDPATITVTPTLNQVNAAPTGAINISVAAGTPIAGLRTAFGANAEISVGSANHVVVRPTYGTVINLTITSGDGDVLTGGASIVGTTRVVGHDNWIEFWS